MNLLGCFVSFLKERWTKRSISICAQYGRMLLSVFADARSAGDVVVLRQATPSRRTRWMARALINATADQPTRAQSTRSTTATSPLRIGLSATT